MTTITTSSELHAFFKDSINNWKSAQGGVFDFKVKFVLNAANHYEYIGRFEVDNPSWRLRIKFAGPLVHFPDESSYLIDMRMPWINHIDTKVVADLVARSLKLPELVD